MLATGVRERQWPGFAVAGEVRLAGVIEQPSCVPDITFDQQEAFRLPGVLDEPCSLGFVRR
jgi:hypothetical protein